MTPLRRLFAIILVGCFASGAHAQTSAPSASEMALGREQFASGMYHARAERWAEASAAFERAYTLTHRPAILINLATAQAQTGRPVEAAESLRQFLRDDHEVGERRTAAEAALAELLPEIPHATLTVAGLAVGDELRLDEGSLSRAVLGSPLPIDPGPHVVTVVRGGATLVRSTFVIEAGSHIESTVAIDAAARPDAPVRVESPTSAALAATGPVAPALSSPVDGTDATEHHDDGGIIALVVILSVVAVGAGVGIGLGFGLSQPSAAPMGFSGNLGSWALP